VLGFEAVFFDRMGNAKLATSKNANFTEEQRNLIRELRRNQRFNISRVKAIGPDGIERTLPYALEITIN
jgi:hypothetical protein